MKTLNDYVELAGINQAELARRLGISQGQLNHWMQGRRKPTVANLKLISEKTGISLEKLARDL